MMHTQTFLEELDLQQAGEALTEPEDELITLYFYAARGQNRFLLEVSDASSLRALKRQAAKEINRCVRTRTYPFFLSSSSLLTRCLYAGPSIGLCSS